MWIEDLGVDEGGGAGLNETMRGESSGYVCEERWNGNWGNVARNWGKIVIDAWKTRRFMCNERSKTKGCGRGDDTDEGGGGLEGRSLFCPGGFRWTRAKCFKGLTLAYTLCSREHGRFLKHFSRESDDSTSIISSLIRTIRLAGSVYALGFTGGLKRYRRFPGVSSLLALQMNLRFMQQYFYSILASMRLPLSKYVEDGA